MASNEQYSVPQSTYSKPGTQSVQANDVKAPATKPSSTSKSKDTGEAQPEVQGPEKPVKPGIPKDAGESTDETGEAQPEVQGPEKPVKPETVEEKINRILKEKPPEPPKKETIAGMSKKFVSEKVEDALGKLGVPKKYHGTIKKAAVKAVMKGAGSLMDKTLNAAGLEDKSKKAVMKALEAGAKTPVY